jgi:hypothetical protein
MLTNQDARTGVVRDRQVVLGADFGRPAGARRTT